MKSSLHITADRFPLVRDMGWNVTNQTYTHPDRVLDYHVFLYVSKGSMQLIEDGVSYIVGEREFMFLEKGLHHWGRPETTAGTTWYWIHFYPADDRHLDYKDQAPLPEPDYYAPEHYEHRIYLPKHGLAPPGTEERLSAIVKESEQRDSYRLTRISISAYRFLLDLASMNAISSSKRGTAAELADRVLNYLSAHLEEPFNASEIGKHLNMNYSHISATFRKTTGQSIVETHTRLKMNKAVELLRTSSRTITEISEQLGYQNPFYFTRVFKKTFGEPPSSFIQQFYKP
ncbi:AraC family transcriptional regulator [Paenibacillus sp. YIM B09110]|uniref:AraC family transcriptional regulator n=1 Tax=Paenibacillus sp. YIM B09110 TaxID=3126102 RepID=UPI00301C0F35